MKRYIQNASPALIGNEEKYVLDCIKTNWISSLGKYINKFETGFARYHNIKFAVSCNSGTAALHIALLALGIKKGDEVLVPALTYVASINAVTYCGATPVLVDIDPETWNIDTDLIKKSITSKTKAIIVVHLFGHPADMDPIMKIAKKHKIFVVEDNAQGMGALYKGTKTGTIGNIGTFSFFGSKLITTGEGGMTITNDIKLSEKSRIFKNQGMEPNKRYWFPVVGYNYRMTNLEAAIGLAQLEKIKTHIKNRRKIAYSYIRELKNVNSITLPVEKDYAFSVYWMFNISLKDNLDLDRDLIIKKLIEYGIDARYISYPLNTLPPYRKIAAGKKFPIAEKVSLRSITLPTHENLTQGDIKYICSKLKLILNGMTKKGIS